jgi:hypothetical protein
MNELGTKENEIIYLNGKKKVRKKKTWRPCCLKDNCTNRTSNEFCNKHTEKNITFERSFASYTEETKNGKLKIECWIKEKNNNKTPRDITKGTTKKYWFKCDICNHDFKTRIDNITCNTRWCSYCTNQKLCDDKNCNHCFEKSFASYTEETKNGKLKIDCWIKEKNNKTPRDIFKATNKKYWFKCDICNHEFEKIISSITCHTIWCPYCVSQKLCDDENCNHCFERSFASYDSKTANGKLKIDCWIKKKNNDLTPRDITKGACNKYWFKCDVCKKNFETRIGSITCNNVWCPNCKNKTELKLHNELEKLSYIKSIQREYKPKWCSTEYTEMINHQFKVKRYQYRYDFLVKFKNGEKLIIELDGPQHFIQVFNWKGPFLQQIRDKYKEFKAKKKKIPLTRLLQEDVYYDRNDWLEKLEIIMKNISNKNEEFTLSAEH